MKNGISRYVKGFGALTLASALTIISLMFAVNAAGEQRVVRVGYPLQEGLCEIDGNGTYTGYVRDYLDKVAQFTGWKYEFITYDQSGKELTQADMLAMLKSEELDLLGGLLKTDELESTYFCCQRSYGIVYSNLAASAENTDMTQSSILGDKGLRVAVLEGATCERQALKKFLESVGTEYKTVVCQTEEEQYRVLADGAADVMLGRKLSRHSGNRVVAFFDGQPCYFASGEDTGLIAELDETIGMMDKAYPYFQKELYQFYFDTEDSDIYLTEEERAYIAQRAPVRVLMEGNRVPFQIFDEKGEIYGVTCSVLERITQQTGLRFEIVTENAELNGCVPSNAAMAMPLGVIATDPFVTTGMSVVYGDEVEIGSGWVPVAALSKECQLPLSFSCGEILPCNSYQECLEAVVDGRASATSISTLSAAYYLAQYEYTDLHAVPVVGLERGVSFGVYDKTDIMLLTILNKAIRSISDADMSEYLVEALGRRQDTGMKEIMDTHPAESALGIVLLLAVIMGIYLTMKAQRSKTEELERISQAKSVFLSRVAHEMRTPLAAIIGLDDLERENLGDKLFEEECVDKLRSVSRYLLQLINDMLDMSKIEEGKMRLSEKPFFLRRMIEDTAAVCETTAKGKCVTLKAEIGKKVPDRIVGDELRLRQILVNLLSNAVKYNRQNGSIHLKVELVNEQEGSAVIRFSVRDTGVGIAIGDKNRIFNIFERAANADRDQIVGTGLGLSISRQLVELMGGKLNVDSDLGVGSCFWFAASFHQVDQAELREFEQKADVRELSLTGRRYLLVEDNVVNMMILRKMLESAGAAVDTASNGKEGYDRFVDAQPGQYDGILMDIRMPVMNGYEATKRIRSLDRWDAKDIFIVALSANAYVEDIEHSKQAGMNVHCAKPIERDGLVQILINGKNR